MQKYFLSYIFKRIKAQAKLLKSIAGLYFIASAVIIFMLVYLQGGLATYSNGINTYQDNHYYFDRNISKEVDSIYYNGWKYDLLLNYCQNVDYNPYQVSAMKNDKINYTLYQTLPRYKDYGILYEYDQETVPILLSVTKSKIINNDLQSNYLIINEQMAEIMAKSNLSSVTIFNQEYFIKEVIDFNYPNVNTPLKKYSDSEYKKPIAIMIVDNFTTNINQVIFQEEVPAEASMYYYLENDKHDLNAELFQGKRIKAIFKARHQGTYIFFNLATLIPISLMYLGIIFNFNFIIEKRAREIAIKKIYGAKFINIFFEFLFENLFIATICSILGIILGAILGNISLSLSSLNIYFNLISIISIFLLIIILGIVSSLIIAHNAYSNDLLQSVKEL